MKSTDIPVLFEPLQGIPCLQNRSSQSWACLDFSRSGAPRRPAFGSERCFISRRRMRADARSSACHQIDPAAQPETVRPVPKNPSTRTLSDVNLQISPYSDPKFDSNRWGLARLFAEREIGTAECAPKSLSIWKFQSIEDLGISDRRSPESEAANLRDSTSVSKRIFLGVPNFSPVREPLQATLAWTVAWSLPSMLRVLRSAEERPLKVCAKKLIKNKHFLIRLIWNWFWLIYRQRALRKSRFKHRASRSWVTAAKHRLLKLKIRENSEKKDEWMKKYYRIFREFSILPLGNKQKREI